MAILRRGTSRTLSGIARPGAGYTPASPGFAGPKASYARASPGFAGAKASHAALAMLAAAWIMAAAPAGAQPQPSRPGGAALVEFRALVEGADAALLAGQPAAARDRIERAEALLANARRRGAPRAAAALAGARGAIDRGAPADARAALQPLLQRLAGAQSRGG